MGVMMGRYIGFNFFFNVKDDFIDPKVNIGGYFASTRYHTS